MTSIACTNLLVATTLTDPIARYPLPRPGLLFREVPAFWRNYLAIAETGWPGIIHALGSDVRLSSNSFKNVRER